VQFGLQEHIKNSFRRQRDPNSVSEDSTPIPTAPGIKDVAIEVVDESQPFVHVSEVRGVEYFDGNREMDEFHVFALGILPYSALSVGSSWVTMEQRKNARNDSNRTKKSEYARGMIPMKRKLDWCKGINLSLIY
jgi:hypothetical protein